MLPMHSVHNDVVLIFLIEPGQIPSQHEISNDLPLLTKGFQKSG